MTDERVSLIELDLAPSKRRAAAARSDHANILAPRPEAERYVGAGRHASALLAQIDAALKDRRLR